VSDTAEPEAPQPEPQPASAASGDAGDAAGLPPALAEPGDVATQRPQHPFYLRGRRLRPPRSRRGLFALLLLLAGGGFLAVYTAVSLISWTETAGFCGRCHTMAPELQAYEAGPHRSVDCAACHVEPGIIGWIKAKINGTKQLIDVVLGTYPTPIPPPDHSDMPSTADTCESCHGVTREAVTTLKTEIVYSEDAANTPQFIGLVIRPGGGDPFNVNRSVHWHVERTVNFYSTDPAAQTIDLVEATQLDGSIATYIAQDKVRVAENVKPDVDAITTSESETTMSCYDCHNRIGHDIANPRTSLDDAMQTGSVNPTQPGAIDPTLPFIKQQGMQILWGSYPNATAADAAADGLKAFYALNYPPLATSKAAEIDEAISEIKTLYQLSNTPDMKVTAATYPNNLGHLDFPGCFRCHDGGHYLVVDGKVTNQTIPSTCDTCHTFPQVGAVTSLPLGTPPTTHNDKLWVFDHKTVATSEDPGGQSCGQCHAKDYCTNCHSTGAVTVDHDEMATNHAAVIRKQGNNACAYCHQPVFCAVCHGKNQVLPETTPFSSHPNIPALPPPSAQPGAYSSAAPSPASSIPGTTGQIYPLAASPGG
jgi:nitrate/TMAO reductase-like tetraheme cytochrome c subunit